MPTTEVSDSSGSEGCRGSPVELPALEVLHSVSVPSELDSVPMCRICYNGSSKECLQKPCNCKGSVRYVHRSCLERWLTENNSESCEICQYHFLTIRKRMSCWDWFKTSQGQWIRRNMVSDFLYIVFLLLLESAILWISSKGAFFYKEDERSIVGLMVLVPVAWFILMGIMIYTIESIKVYWTIWTNWRDNHWYVHLLDGEGVSTPSSSSTSLSSSSSVEFFGHPQEEAFRENHGILPHETED